MKSWLRNFYALLKSLWNNANGEACYKKYLQEYHKENCQKGSGKHLSKKDFFAKIQKEKWNKINRCC